MTDISKEAVERLWKEYCDASTSTGVLPGGIEEFDVDEMNNRAFDLFEHAKALQARVEELEARADLFPAAVTVKPLEWDGRKTTDVMFQYRVHIGYGLMNGVFALTLSGSTIGEFHSEETAKAAAQADYERRILSTLTPAPGEQPVTEGSVTKNCTLNPMPREDVKLPPMIGTTEQPSVKEAAVDALASYQQADEDGIMVLVSRQAIEECLPALRSLAGDE